MFTSLGNCWASILWDASYVCTEVSRINIPYLQVGGKCHCSWALWCSKLSCWVSPSLGNKLMLPRSLIIVAMNLFKSRWDACMKSSIEMTNVVCTCSLAIHAVREVATAVGWVISLMPFFLVTSCFIDLICLILPMRYSRGGGHTWICPFSK